MVEFVKNPDVREAIIKVVGIGSGGVNAINTMIARQVYGVEYIAMNTDLQSLSLSQAEIKLDLSGVTKGRGAGGDPAKGRESAIQERPRIEEFLKDADMVVIATGLGGGTGTGATPVVAEIAKGMGKLTVCFVTLPFPWEGKVKEKRALEGLEIIKKVSDAYIIIPNEKLKKVAPKNMPALEAFALVDGVLCDSMTGVVDLITRPGFINRDFEDVKAVLGGCGLCVMGTGFGQGQDRAIDAVTKAIYNPFLEDTPIDGAKNVLVNVVMGPDGSLDENELIVSKVQECIDKEGNISFGLAVDKNLGDGMRVTIIASGLNDIEPIDTQLVVEIAQPVQVKPLPVETQGQPVQQGLPGIMSRPGFSESGGFERARGSYTSTPITVNSAASFSHFPEGESELDPTPTFLRVGQDIMKTRKF